MFVYSLVEIDTVYLLPAPIVYIAIGSFLFARVSCAVLNNLALGQIVDTYTDRGLIEMILVYIGVELYWPAIKLYIFHFISLACWVAANLFPQTHLVPGDIYI